MLRGRNKSKYEYTLQGWKAFALSHSVQTGDRLQIELLPDSRRIRADIVKRAELKQRVVSDPGPESPTLPDMASTAKRQHAAGATLPRPTLLLYQIASNITRNNLLPLRLLYQQASYSIWVASLPMHSPSLANINMIAR